MQMMSTGYRYIILPAFTISFVGIFVPIADIAKIGEVGKTGEILAKINEEIGKTISQSAKFVKRFKVQEAYQKISIALQEFLEMFAKRRQETTGFCRQSLKRNC